MDTGQPEHFPDIDPGGAGDPPVRPVINHEVDEDPHYPHDWMPNPHHYPDGFIINPTDGTYYHLDDESYVTPIGPTSPLVPSLGPVPGQLEPQDDHDSGVVHRPHHEMQWWEFPNPFFPFLPLLPIPPPWFGGADQEEL